MHWLNALVQSDLIKVILCTSKTQFDIMCSPYIGT